MKQKLNLEDEEPRNYFRLDIDLPLEVRLASSAEKDNMYAEYIDDLDLLDLAPSSSSSESTDLMTWMRLVNDKLNTIIAMLASEGNPPVTLKRARVNLSANGMSFFTTDAYNVGDILQIKMTIEEKNKAYTIKLFGQVIFIQKMEGKNISNVGTEFVFVGDDITNVIANFIMNKERETLRGRLE